MAEPRLRVRVLLNKGKKGVSLHRLPRILSDIQKFLDSLSEDTVGKSGDWMGLEFRSTESVEYTAESVDVVEQERIRDFDECLKSVVRSQPNPKIRPSTLQQYFQIAQSSIEETVSFGVGSELEPDSPTLAGELEWLDLNRGGAANLGVGQSLVRSHGGLQGFIQSLFLGPESPHFYLKELSIGERIPCEYDESKYPEIVEALKRPRAIIHVYGIILTDLAERKIRKMHVSHIDVAPSLTLADLDRFIGSAPEMIDPDGLQAFIDESRGREQL
ncbi:MAG: hypothetical protein ACR2IV_11480 [Bryobacteraceae bacterium]